MILVFFPKRKKQKQKGRAGESLIGLRVIGISVLLFLFLRFFVLRWVSGHGQIILLPHAYQLHTPPPFFFAFETPDFVVYPSQPSRLRG